MTEVQVCETETGMGSRPGQGGTLHQRLAAAALRAQPGVAHLWAATRQAPAAAAAGTARGNAQAPALPPAAP